jgi:hypothetical protein
MTLYVHSFSIIFKPSFEIAALIEIGQKFPFFLFNQVSYDVLV